MRSRLRTPMDQSAVRSTTSRILVPFLFKASPDQAVCDEPNKKQSRPYNASATGHQREQGSLKAACWTSGTVAVLMETPGQLVSLGGG